MELYIHATVHRNRFLFLNNQPEAPITPLLFHPDSAWKRSSETCVKLTSDECTVENPWWWAEKISETCRVL